MGPAGQGYRASHDEAPAEVWFEVIERYPESRSPIGRSRGGLTTKTHVLLDDAGLPLVIALTPGQAGDSPALPKLLAELRIPRLG